MTDIELLSGKARQKAAKAEAGLFERPGIDAVTASIDHTLINAASSPASVASHCEEALARGFASVFIPMTSLRYATGILKGTAVRVGTVASFPMGTSPLAVKTAEIRWAIDNGADEVDVVLDIQAILCGDRQAVRGELFSLHEAAAGSIVRVVLEMPLLDDTRAITTLRLAEQAGINSVSTCSGFSGPVSFYHTALLRTAASDSTGIKASGGICSYGTAEIMKALGADRIGTSNAPDFLIPKR